MVFKLRNPVIYGIFKALMAIDAHNLLIYVRFKYQLHRFANYLTYNRVIIHMFRRTLHAFITLLLKVASIWFVERKEFIHYFP